MDIQFQIRQNAMEMQEYMKDLFDWQKSIKKKERAMTASNAASKDQQVTSSGPAPRGRAGGTVPQAPAELMQPALGPQGPAAASRSPPAASTPAGSGPASEQVQQSTRPKHAAAHTYSSYNKWDKFDVEAALASDDDEPGPRQKAAGASTSGKAGPGPAPSQAVAANATSKGASAPALASSAAGASSSTYAGPSPPVLAPPGITITAQDPAARLQEGDLLRPVSTIRTPQPAASAPSSTVGGPSTSNAPPTSTSASAAPSLPPIRNSQPVTADGWRTRGNDLFRAAQYDSAYECYSRSVELQPTCLGHANRAMALLKLGRWQEAVDDCSAAVALDPTYVKAYQRRAAAHRQLGASLEAARDWEAALRLEPENRATAADRDASLEALLAERKLQPPNRRAAVPVAWPAAAAEVISSAAAVADSKTAARAAAGGVMHVDGGAGAEAEVAPAAAAEAAPVTKAEPAGAGAAAAAPAPRPQAVAPSRTEEASPQRSAPTASPAPAAAAASTSSAPPRAASVASAAAAAAAVAATATAQRASAAPPRTSVEFEAAWRGLGGDQARQAAYLSAIPPASLPSIFKSSLTAPVLSAMVRSLLAGMTSPAPPAAAAAADRGDDGADVSGGGGGALSPGVGVALLSGLTGVARFDMMAMSVPSRERAELRAAWEAAEAALRSGGSEAAATQLAALRPKFRL